MNARWSQFGIAVVFLSLGSWALIAPGSVIELAISAPYRENSFLNRFIMACFGAQAVLFGIMALIVRWSSRGFGLFAALLLPFFWFNYHFHYLEPVLTSIEILDFVGNATMLILALIGWRAAKREESEL